MAGYKFPKEHISWNKGRKMSRAFCLNRTGKKHWGYGKHFSKERKLKISKALKGKPKSLKVRKAVAEANRKRVWTVEMRRASSLARLGSKGASWKGGKTAKIQLLKNGLDWMIWREKIFKRDNWTCRWCKKRGGNLEPHHIKKLSKYPKLVFKLSNGITLCRKCHKKTFRKEEQFELMFKKLLCV